MTDMKSAGERDSALRMLETFDTLPVERRVEIFRELSPIAREELLQVVGRPGEITRRISPEEMYFTVKAVGEERAPALVGATTGRQLLFLLDLDLWKNEMFRIDAAERWLKILAGLGEEKILQYLQITDPELVAATMRGLVQVRARNPDVDLMEDQDSLPFFTLDDLYFIRFLRPGTEDSLRSFFETLFAWNSRYYFGLMEELTQGLSIETEEEARRLRLARLADYGFPEFDEALEIYGYLQRSAIAPPSHDQSEELTESYEPDEAVRPFLGYPLKILEGTSLFRRCLEEIRDGRDRDRVTGELAHLANKVMVADARDPGAVEDLTGSLQKVSGYINIALEDMCGENMSEAVGLLLANHMEILFRRGFSLILDLRKDAQKLLRGSAGGVENLGHPLSGLIEGLLLKRPLFAENFLRDAKSREFASLEDIRFIRDLVHRAASEESWEPI